MKEDPGGLGLKLDFLKNMYHAENEKYEAALLALKTNPTNPATQQEAYAAAAVSSVLSIVVYFLETGRTDGSYEG